MSIPNLEDFDPREFASQIRVFLLRNKMTTRQWAALTGSSPATIYRMEAGETDLTIETIAKFQRFMRDFKAAA